MREKMKYKIKAILANSNAPERITNFKVRKLNALFGTVPERYGNGYYVIISGSKFCCQIIDLSCDEEFDPNNKAAYLEKWARNHWSGKDGTYCLKLLKITPVK